MDEPAAVRLAFHIEAPGSATESLKNKMARIDGVRSVEARAVQPARAIDAQSVGTVLVLITAAAKTGAITTGYIQETIQNVKKIAAEIGLTKIFVEKGYEKKDVNLLSHDDIEVIAEKTAVKAPPANQSAPDA